MPIGLAFSYLSNLSPSLRTLLLKWPAFTNWPPSTFSHSSVHRKGCGDNFLTGMRPDEQIIILNYHQQVVSSGSWRS